jgi:hypothetical protein
MSVVYEASRSRRTWSLDHFIINCIIELLRTPMTIAKPYVYRCEHRITSQFYFGYRYANTAQAVMDLGIHYFTSSSTVSNDFSNYNYEILSEYNSQLQAFEVEQRLIFESINNPLCLNKNCKMKNLMPLNSRPVKESSRAQYKKTRNGGTARSILIKI